MTRANQVKRILKLTGKAGEVAYFDKLDAKSDSYLSKLLKVCEKLSKNAV